jgi:hypothetical protein
MRGEIMKINYMPESRKQKTKKGKTSLSKKKKKERKKEKKNTKSPSDIHLRRQHRSTGMSYLRCRGARTRP